MPGNDGINVAKTFCHGKKCLQPTFFFFFCIHDTLIEIPCEPTSYDTSSNFCLILSNNF